MPRGLRAWCKLPVMKAMMLTQLVSRQGVRVPCKERETTGKCFKRVPFLTACIYVWAQAINHCTDPVTRNGMHVVRFTMCSVRARRQCLWPPWQRETLKQSTHDSYYSWSSLRFSTALIEALVNYGSNCVFLAVCVNASNRVNSETHEGSLFVYWQFSTGILRSADV